MTGTLTGLLGNRILLMSRSKTFTPCSPLTFLSLFIASQTRQRVIISDYSLGRSETLKKFHSHVLPLSGEKA